MRRLLAVLATAVTPGRVWRRLGVGRGLCGGTGHPRGRRAAHPRGKGVAVALPGGRTSAAGLLRKGR